MTSSVHNRLFSPGGCLSPLAIRSYLDGSLRLSGRMQVEDHLSKCKFCTEALDGYKSRGSKNYLHSDVEYLTRKVRRAYHVNSYGSGRRMPVLIVFTLALFLLVLALIFFILHQNITNPKSSQKVKADTTVQTRASPADTTNTLHVVKSE